MMDKQPSVGRIASRPRWRAAPRATACLGLTALIACAGCEQGPVHRYTCTDDAGVTFSYVGSANEVINDGIISLTDENGILHAYSGNFRLTCWRGPASGTETRQGEDRNGLRAEHDGPAPKGDAR